MSAVTPSQLKALARIKFNGLDVWTGNPFNEGAAGILDTPPPSFERVNIATVRKLIREGWIGNLATEDDELERSTIWILTAEGNALLARHKEYLEPASREAQDFRAQAVFRQIAIAQKPEKQKALGEWAARIEWTKEGLHDAGFMGFIPFRMLPEVRVPRSAGVYIVFRVANTPPKFRETSIAGHFKGKPPTVQVSELEAKWVPDMPVLYVGKAEVNDGNTRGLAKRLDEYRRHGSGEPIGHWGGRYVWQLEDCDDLVVAWIETPTNGAENVESAMLSRFVESSGVLPFANLKRGRRLT